jgi:predicted DNA-binding transcriptional regulator AlpA
MALLRDGVEPPTQPTKPTEPRLLRRAEVARRLGCSVRLVDRLATEGVLPKHRLPNRRRAAGVLEADLIALITASPLPAPRQTVEAT